MKKIKKIIQLKSKDVAKLRTKLLKEQNGRCLICEGDPDRPCLDHSHKKKIKGSGLIRGVLCSTCNVFLAKVENNCIRCGISHVDLPAILINMAKYLKKEELPFIHPTEKEKEPKLMKSSFATLKKIFITKYPKRKAIEYPKSKKMTKTLQVLYAEFKLKPKFYKQK